MIRDRIGRHEDRFFATVFLGSGLLFVAMLFVAAAVAGGLIAASSGPSGPPGTDTLAAGRNVTSILLNVYAMRMAAVLKILFMTALSLIVAVILFGAMDSSGVVDSGGVKLGGAFAGFIVTLAWLNRIWGPDDLMQQAGKAGTQIVYEEVLKTLDLRRAPPSADEQRARTS